MSSGDRLSRLTADLVAPPPAHAEVPKTVIPPSSGARDEGERRLDATPASDRPLVAETRFPAVFARPAGKRTGPGELLAFRGQILAAEGEATRLREELQRFAGAHPTRKIDPTHVHLSRWSNRHETSFATAEFIRFKADIEHAGGNVQPIVVRPLETDEQGFEIVFGHRRHRACLDLGLPVLAVIWTESLSDLNLFAAMDRENRERADLSAWEQGKMYRRAIDEAMFPSQRRLAESLGVSHTWVRKAIAVADLPEPIIQCFRTPLELNFRHAEAITQALDKDRKGVLRRAEKLQQSERFSASAVVAALVGKQRGVGDSQREIRLRDAVAGRVTWDARGQATIRLLPGVVHAENIDALIAAVTKVLTVSDADGPSRSPSAKP